MPAGPRSRPRLLVHDDAVSRRSFTIGALLVASVVLVGVGLWLRSNQPTQEAGSVVLVGDSLNVGIEPYLPQVLHGWRVRSDDLVGRSTADGLSVLARMREQPGPLVISLGTNDDPAATGAFAADVERALALAGPGRCVIWATLWRDGAPEDGLNGVLEAAARQHTNLRLLSWASMLAGHPEWRAPDGTHGSPDGYAARADEAARLVRSCPAEEAARPGGATP